jgi:hypothetical protein
MPLDHTNGEIIEGLGKEFRVVPNDKWRESKLFETAARTAATAFLKAGALWPVRFDDREILMQEYPADNRLVIVFQKTIRGNETLFPWVWDLPPEMVKELAALGKWQTNRLQ